jgi:hypothetical protein
MCNPWKNLEFENIKPPSELETSLFVTAAGLALIDPKDVWK